MRRITSLATPFLVACILLVFFLSTPIASAQSTVFYCTFSTQQGTQVTYYTSGLVRADVAAYRSLEDAWNKYVRANYPINNPQAKGACQDLGADPSYQQSFGNAQEQGWRSHGATVVHVNWKYTPAPAAAPAAASSLYTAAPLPPGMGAPRPAAAAAPASTPAPAHAPANSAPPASSASALTKAYHCVLYVHQGTKSVRYSSGAIRTDVKAPLLNAAWKNEVLATYNVNDPHAHGGCQPISAIPARQDNVVNSLEENWKRLGANVIHINWTSAPGQIAAAPSAPPAPSHSATARTAPPVPPVHSVTTHSPAQTLAQTAQPVPLAQDPRLAQIPSRIRGMMISEANAYESTCQGGPAPGTKSACECVARNILNYRITHASQYSIMYDEHDLVGHVVGWDTYSSFLAEAKQGCPQ